MKKYILNSLSILFLFIQTVCFGQTAKTWTGATSTNWGTASNWSPSGVPGSSDNITIPNVTNDPVLDASRTAGTITFQSGASLDFGTYTLTASGLVSASTSSLSNGKLIAIAGFNSASSTVDVFLQATGNSLTINTSTFKKTVYLTKTGATAVTCYGNTFEKPFHITSNASAAISFGYGLADTFKDSVLALVSGSAAINFASYSANNRFEGFSRFERGSTATGNGIFFCNSNSSASVNFLGKVEVGSASGTIYTGFEITRNATFSSGAKLKISPMGWSGCNLNISGITSSDSVVLNLGGTSILNMLGTSTYNSPVTVTSPRVFLGVQTFNSSFNLTKTGASTDQSTSSLVCNGPANINNTGSGYLLLPGNSNEVFGSTVSISNTSNGQIDICRNGLSTFNGKVTLTITSGIITLANLATTSAHFNGDIELNATGGSVIIGKLDHANGYKLTAPTYTAGTLYLNKYVYNSTDSLNLTASGTARLYLTNCEVHGPAKFIFPAVFFAGAGEFYENTLFVKTGSSSEDGAGGLIFHKKAHFKTTGTGNLQINYSGADCVYNDDMIIECTGSGKICPGYTGNHNLNKNLEFRGSTLPNMSFGSNMRFIGSQDQHISSSGLSSGHQILKLEINKPSGNVVLDVPISVLGQLKLSKGLIQSTSSNLLTAGSSMAISGIVGGSDSSYVDGPMAKSGTIAFYFPIGGGGQFAPLNTDAVGTSTTFKAQYFGVDPNISYSRASKDASLGYINRCGYWQLDRTSGTGNTKASLGWSNNPCFSSSPVDAKVAIWDGSLWIDKGNGTYSGTSSIGNIQCSASITTYPSTLNVSGVCGLSAGLSANRDTLFSGYLATLTAFPSNQSSYKFYVNNILKQDSSISHFKTHSLFNGDTIKVEIRNLDGCVDEIAKSFFMMNAPSITVPQLNETIALFAGDSILVDSIAIVVGNSAAIKFIDNGIHHIVGSNNIGSNISNINELATIENLFNSTSSIEGWYVSPDSNITFSNSGQYNLSDIINLSKVVFEGDSNSIYIIYSQNNYLIDTSFEIVLNGVSPTNIFWICNNFEIQSGARFTGNVIAKNAIIRPMSNHALRVFSENKISILNANRNDRTYISSVNIMMFKTLLTCCSSSIYNCNLVCNGDFESTVPNIEWLSDPPVEIPLSHGLMVFYSSCWDLYNGSANNSPDLFAVGEPEIPSDIPMGNQSTCIQFPTTDTPNELSIGIPNNYLGENVYVIPPTQSYPPIANNHYAAFDGYDRAVTILTQSFDPNSVYILDYSIRPANCDFGDNSIRSGMIRATLANDNGDESNSMVSYYDPFYLSANPVSPSFPWFRRIFCLNDISNFQNYNQLVIKGGEGGSPSQFGLGTFIDNIRIYKLADAGDDKEICQNEIVTIGGTDCQIPGATYSWSPSYGIVNTPCGIPNCPQVNVAPGNTVTYTLTVNAPHDEQAEMNEITGEFVQVNNCTATDEVIVVVHPLPVIELVTPEAACSNSEICIETPEVNTDYIWTAPNGVDLVSSNQNCTGIVWNNVQYGSLTLNATSQFGCVNSESVFIPTCCQNSIATLTNFKTSDLLEGVNSNSPSVKEEYSSFVSISPIGNYSAGQPNHISMTISVPSSNTLNIIGELLIDVGILTFNQSEVSFSNCSRVSFSPFGSSGQLNIEKSYFHSCGNFLWAGIYLIGSNQEINVTGSSLIEDAQIGIYSYLCAKVNIDESTFNRNKRHLVFENCSNETMSPLNLNNSKLLCNEIDPTSVSFPPNIVDHKFSMIATLKVDDGCNTIPSPLINANNITNIAIQVSGVDILNASPINSERNLIESAYYGITLQNSNLICKYNDFFNILREYNPSGSYSNEINYKWGACIYQTSGKLKSISLNYYRKVSGFLDVEGCNFSNFWRGVSINVDFTKGYIGSPFIDVNILGNSFENSSYINSIYGNQVVYSQDCGVYIEKLAGVDVISENGSYQKVVRANIVRNNFLNLNNAIKTYLTRSNFNIVSNRINYLTLNNQKFIANRLLERGISCSQNSEQLLRFNYNSLSSPSMSYITPLFSVRDNFIGNDGDVSSSTSTYGNPINGIYISRVPFASIKVNHIVAPYFVSSTNQQTAIDIVNSRFTIVNGNNISRDPYVANNNSNSTNAGIRIWNSPFNSITSNSIGGYANSLSLRNDNSNSSILCNTFNNIGNSQAYRTIHFISSNVGNQGDISTPSDNAWDGDPVSGYRIFGNLSNQAPLTFWFYRSLPSPNSLSYYLDANLSSGTNVFVTDGLGTSTFFQPVASISNLMHCYSNGRFQWQGMLGDSAQYSRQSSYSATIRDSLFSEFVKEDLIIDSLYSSPSTVYGDAVSFWKILKQDTSWLNFGLPSDSIYRNYFNKISLSNIGQIHSIECKDATMGIDSVAWDYLLDSSLGNDSLFTHELVTFGKNNLIEANFDIRGLLSKSDFEDKWKSLYSIKINRELSTLDSLTYSQKLTCENYAFSDPDIYGESVFISQILLDTIVSDPLPLAARKSLNLDVKSTSTSKIKVFPNPTSGELTIELFGGIAELYLFSSTGQLLSHQKIINSKTISLDKFSSGSYILEVVNSSGIINHEKLLIIR
jgi:hypothetical protein